MLTHRRRLLAAAVVTGLLSAACISSDPPPAPIAPAAPVDAPTPSSEAALEPATAEQIEAVLGYWEDRDQAFSIGAEAGIQFLVDHNHPQLPYTVDDCREAWFGGEVPPGFAERTAVDPASIMQDPGFMMLTGPLAGRELGDGLVVMNVAFRYEGAPSYVEDRVAQVHLQVDGDDVRNFLLCDVEDITVVQVAPDAEEATTAGGTTGGTATGTGTGTNGTIGVITDPVTILPPITATPSPVTGTTGTEMPMMPAPPAPPPPPGSRPVGSGIDFCEQGAPGAQPVAGDYFLCPDDDIDPNATEMPAGRD